MDWFKSRFFKDEFFFFNGFLPCDTSMLRAMVLELGVKCDIKELALEEKDKEIERLKKELAEAKDARLHFKDLQLTGGQIRKLEKENAGLKKEIDRIDHNNRSLNDSVDTLTKECDELKAENERLKSHLDTKEALIDEIRKSEVALRKERDELKLKTRCEKCRDDFIRRAAAQASTGRGDDWWDYRP
jgi:chromosome segregation ATPase